jgi:hypothetical protein
MFRALIRNTFVSLTILSIAASSASAAKTPKPAPTPKPTLKSLAAEVSTLQATVSEQGGTDTSIQQQLTAIQQQIGQAAGGCTTGPCPVHLFGSLSPDGQGDLVGELTDQDGCQRPITISTPDSVNITPAPNQNWLIQVPYADNCSELDNEIEYMTFYPINTDNGSGSGGDNAGLAVSAHGSYDHQDDCVVNADVGTMDVSKIAETGDWLVNIQGMQTLPDFSQTQFGCQSD